MNDMHGKFFTLGYDIEGGTYSITHTFQIVSVSDKNWGKARLIQIIREKINDDEPATITNYDPKIHFAPGHYMSRPYRVRFMKSDEFDCSMIEVYWCKGETCYALYDDEFTPR